ncbi:class I SAM-dependent methyltransferase [Winogradskya humida]|uniref:Methyltransferase n=1 Tax=Winogradskya humida TaxID=113566 RepID=A0ABQ3ZXJ8_9ACTN|nr:class I SAM-dependent methyltransferase [Actinoplanes humidus]GIE23308.1 methyltransferase [Actinoplanes humidus]
MTTPTHSDAPAPAGPAYSFNNDDRAAADRHRFLAEIFDEESTARIAGLGDLTGSRCLELGAGGGSVARWMVDQVGPTGRVLATDLNPRHIPTDQGYGVLTHNLVTEPVPEGPWDVIHARLVLMHIPERREILPRLAAALAPGGALIIEDFHTALTDLVLAAPDPESKALFNSFQATMIKEVLSPSGTDPTWGPQIHEAMLDAGLADVDTVITARSWPGGTAGALLSGANIQQVRGKLIAQGFTEAQLDSLLRLITDPRFVVRGNLVYSTVGRRPEAGV